MINLLLAVKALEGRNRGLASLPSGPTPLSSSAPSLTSQALFVLSEQSGEQSCIAVWCVKLCGYANVSGLVGVLLNG